MNKTGYASVDKPWLNKKKYNNVVPDVNMTLYNFLYESNKNNLNDVALIYDASVDVAPTKITYRKLFEMIDLCARSYASIGVKKGDIVTVSLPSSIENIVSFYALNKIGAVTNQIHPQVSQDELDFYLEEAESSIFVGYGNIREKIDKLNYKGLKNVIIVDLKDKIKAISKIKLLIKSLKTKKLKELKKEKLNNDMYMYFDDFMKQGLKYKDLNINYDGTLLATLTHTSGTSGKSKAVMTDSIAFNSSVCSIMKETNLFKRHDKELLALPPFPLYILNNVVHLSLSVGIELVVVPKINYDCLSDYFKKYQLNHLKGIPFIMQKIVNDQGFDNIKLNKFKFLISGGGKLTNETEVNDFLKNHGCKYKIANGYGMSEVGGCATCMFDNTFEFGTVGRPLIGYDAKIMNFDGNEEIKYTSNENGEIWLGGPGVMQGYYKNENETSKVMVIDSDNKRWIKTGDLGRITDEGNIKVIGRIKRMTFIFDSNTNTASKVSHDYVESTLCENKDVSSCVVVASPNEKLQNVLKAYIVVKNNSYDKVITELDDICKNKFRKVVAPVEYIVVDKIPKSNAGKDDYLYVESYENGNRDNPKMKVLYKRKVKS